MSTLNFLRFIFELKDVQFIQQITIYEKNNEITRMILDEMNMKSWNFDYIGSELKLYFYNHENINKLPKIFHGEFEILRLIFREAKIVNIRLEKSSQKDFFHLLVHGRDNLHYYMKMYIPFNNIENIKEYIDARPDLKDKIELIKTE